MKKIIFTGLFIITTFCVNAQLQVNLETNGGYLLDTIHRNKISIGIDKIKLTAFKEGSNFFNAEYNGIACFVDPMDIVITGAYNRYVKKLTKEQDGKNPYIQEYGERFGKLVTYHAVVIGMTSDMVLSSIGVPKHKTTTQDAYGIYEVWEYHKSEDPLELKLVYFDNGRVNSITE